MENRAVKLPYFYGSCPSCHASSPLHSDSPDKCAGSTVQKLLPQCGLFWQKLQCTALPVHVLIFHLMIFF